MRLLACQMHPPTIAPMTATIAMILCRIRILGLMFPIIDRRLPSRFVKIMPVIV
ncbi:hypothetical protein [Methylobacterium phyllostachyos]|uniref:hypothetical protein n=1 Tax=Methylobacterium phyllostachyos TaxID=582672 RepID=UPI001FCDC98C|nr:hypothetical protein [Methylobacterium phyllostachyos]